jgi:uncharacterized protein (TIGR03083 family)
VERPRYLAAIEEESAAFHAAAASAGLAAPVPSCPEWAVRDLVFHLGSVQWFWGEIAGRRLLSPNDVEDPAGPPDDELIEWGQRQTSHLQSALAATDPTTRVWTWAPRQDVAFIDRRMAHEAAVHRWDAQLAAGRTWPIDAERASDGVDEFLTVMLVDPRFSSRTIGGSAHLHATDTPGEWLVREEVEGNLVVTAEHAKGDAALRGPASDLLLVLWGRLPLDHLEVIGDRVVAERLLGRTTLR